MFNHGHEAVCFVTILPDGWSIQMKAETVRPIRPLVIYDGDCNFCINGTNQIKKQDRNGWFDFLPQQTPNLSDDYPQLKVYAHKEGMRFIDKHGHVFCGSDAVFEIYRRVGWQRYVSWIYRLPILHQLCKIGYWIVAKNRHRLNFGKSVDCQSDICQID